MIIDATWLFFGSVLCFGGGAALIVLGGHLMGMFAAPVAVTTTCTWTNTSAADVLTCPKP